MHRLLTSTLKFLRREDGPAAVEYALVLALIIVVCIVAITALGTGVTKPFKKYSKTQAMLVAPASPTPVALASQSVLDPNFDRG